MRSKVPPFVSRISLMLAVIGLIVGIALSSNHDEARSASLVHGVILGAVFGTVSRWWLGSMTKAWLEYRLEAIQAGAHSTTNFAAGNTCRSTDFTQ